MWPTFLSVSLKFLFSQPLHFYTTVVTCDWALVYDVMSPCNMLLTAICASCNFRLSRWSKQNIRTRLSATHSSLILNITATRFGFVILRVALSSLVWRRLCWCVYQLRDLSLDIINCLSRHTPRLSPGMSVYHQDKTFFFPFTRCRETSAPQRKRRRNGKVARVRLLRDRRRLLRGAARYSQRQQLSARSASKDFRLKYQ